MSIFVSLTLIYNDHLPKSALNNAEAMNLYMPICKPDLLNVVTAGDLVIHLIAGIACMGVKPHDKCLLGFVLNYLDICKQYPDAIVSVYERE